MTVTQVIKTKFSNHIQVRSTKFKPKLEYYAQLDRTTVSNIVNQALEQYIKRREKNNQPFNPLAHWQGKGVNQNQEFEKLTQYLEENKTLINRDYDFN
jgi:hypothetical protein